MQMLYGYDVAADLAPQTRYDEVVKALGGAGETVTDPRRSARPSTGPSPSGVPYLVNVITDVERGLPARHLRHLSRCGSGAPGPRTYAAVGEVTVAAYARRSPRAPTDRTSSSCATPRPATARRSCGWPRDDGDELLGTVTICPPGSPWREICATTTRASSGCSRWRRRRAGRGVGEALVQALRSTGSRRRACTRWCSRRCRRWTPPTGSTSGSASGATPERDWSPGARGRAARPTCYPSRPRKRDRSTTTRVTSPEPTSLPASVAATVKRTSRPSTWATEAVTCDLAADRAGREVLERDPGADAGLGPGQLLGRARHRWPPRTRRAGAGCRGTGRSPDPTRGGGVVVGDREGQPGRRESPGAERHGP